MYGKSACPVLRGAGVNRSMDEILWHRRESRRRTEKTNIVLQLWETPAYSKGGLAGPRHHTRPGHGAESVA
jgi:hypothetical protein